MFKKKNENEIRNIPIELIKPNPYQPRRSFNDTSLEELSRSIKSYGIIQPILLREISKENYEIIAGERRWRASRILGLKEIPAIIKESRENDSAIMALIENIQRENLGFLEEAEGYNQLIQEHSFTQEQLAKEVGKNQSTVANKLRLLKLPDSVKRNVTRENLSERHARSLLRLHDEELQNKVIKEISERSLNVRETEDLIDDILGGEIKEAEKEKKNKRNFIRAFKDIRIFTNQMKKLVNTIKESGVKVKYNEVDKGDFVEVTVQIPKNKLPQ